MKKVFLIFFLSFLLFTSERISFASNSGISEIETAIIQEDYEKAQSMAQEMLTYPLDFYVINEVEYYLALTHLRLSEYEQGREIFKKLIKSDADVKIKDKAYLGLFECYYLEGQYRDALASIQKMLKQNSKTEFLSLAYLKLARANLKLSRWKKAKEYLKRIETEFPESLESHTAKQLLEEKQYFAVQVGAFFNQDRAEKLAEELMQKKNYAYIIETFDAEDNVYYRVRVGQMALLEEAEKLRYQLSQEGYPAQVYP